MDKSISDILQRVGSLPPHVMGKINGYLSLTVEDIKWHIEPQDVHIYVSWWGEKQEVLFVPQAAQICGSLERTYIYRIMTNTELFVMYLQDCEELNFEFYKPDTKFHLGSAVLNNLVSIILYNPFKTSCVVADKDGSEIADVTISFVFYNCASLPKVFESPESGVYNMIEKIQTMDMKDHRKNCIAKKIFVSSIPNSDFQQIKPESLNLQNKRNVVNFNKIDDIVSNCTISELLEQSQNIRQEYYNYEKVALMPKEKRTEIGNVNTEPIIRDYLFGKDLSKDEVYIALEAVKLQPEQELLQLTKDCDSKFEKDVETNNKQGEQNVQFRVYAFETKSCEKIGKEIKDSQNEEKRNEVTLNDETCSLYGSEEKESTLFCSKYLRLTIQTLSLNYLGMQRVIVSSQTLATSSHLHKSAHHRQLPPNIVYFVEYEIPQCLRVHTNESCNARKPWYSNLNRICSRQKASKCIHFYRQTIHTLAAYKPRFRELLCSSTITFKVYSRHLNQRLPYFIGEASLSLGKVVNSYAINGLQELSIFPQSQGDSSHMLSLGILKLKAEFGSSQTCFEMKQHPSIVTQSLASSSESECESGDIDKQSPRVLSKGSILIDKPVDGKLGPQKNIRGANVIDRRNISAKNFNKGKIEPEYKISKNSNNINKNILLFGLLYVSIGREIKASGIYIISHGFWKEDVMTSDIHWHTENPLFKFHKIMPVLLTLELLDRCYNNFMVVEVWSQSSLIGIAKLPLNQFYIAYRDPPVVEQLLSSKYPIISVDGWIDVRDPVTHSYVGQLNVLLALGTENQIQMLEMSRCLKEEIFNTSQSTSPVNDIENLETGQILKFQSGGSFQNEIDFHCNNELSGDTSTLLMESNNATSKDVLFVSCDSSDDSFQKSTDKNNCEELDVDDCMLLQPSQNVDILEVEDVPVNFNDTLVKTGHTQGVGISMIQEHLILESPVGYLETLETNRNLEISSQKSLYKKPLHMSQNMINTCDERNSIMFHKENPHLSNSDEISSGKLLNNENAVFDIYCSDLLHANSHDRNNVEHSSVNIASDISESRLKSWEIPNNFPCEIREMQERYPQHSVLTLENLNKDKRIIVNSKEQEPRNQTDYQSKKFYDNSSVVALTENASTQTDILCAEHFFAMIEVLSGLYISKLDNGELPNCYITFHIANNLVMSTSVVYQNTDPIWNWSCEVWLPVSLLENNGTCLIFKVWHKNNSHECTNPLDDVVIGFVAIDLRVLVCGLPFIIGWFNINDLSGNCKGQMQVSITPLGNISEMRSSSVPKLKIDEIKNEKYLKSKISSKALLCTDVEKFEEIIFHNKVDSEVNSVSNYLTQDGKESVNFITQNQDSYQVQNHNDKQSLCKNVLDNHDSKIDILPPKINKTHFNCDNQMCGENDCQNDKSDILINDVLLDQNYFKNLSHMKDSKDMSTLTETLQLKFRELDEIIQQMKNRSRGRSTDFETKVIDNTLSSELQTNENNYSEIVDCANKYKSVNSSQKLSKENIDKPSENRKSSEWPFFHTKKVIQKENVKSLESDASTQLPLTSEYPNCLSFDTVSPVCVKSASKNNQGRCEASETKNMVCSDFVENCSPSDLMTDHLMCVALHEMDLENIFNPLLFQHIIANHQAQNCCSEWYDETRGSPFSFHKINRSASGLSKRNKMHLWKSHNYANILSQMSIDRDLKECDQVNESLINNRKQFTTCDSPPMFSDEIIVSSETSQNCIETHGNTKQNSSCEYPSFPKHLKQQDDFINQNSSQKNKTSTERNSIENENFIQRNVTSLSNTGSSHYTSSIQLTSQVKGQCQDQIILKTNSYDKSNNILDSLGNCSCELENIENVIEHTGKMLVTSYNKAIITDTSEKKIPEEINVESSVFKLSDECLCSENYTGQDKV